jgi:hypothetical protein
MSPESRHLCRNPVGPDSDDQSDRIPATWPESGQNSQARAAGFPAGWPESGQNIPARTAGFRPVCRRLAVLNEFRQFFGWNPVFMPGIRPTQILTRLSGFRPLSYSQNSIKVVGILSINDRNLVCCDFYIILQ